MFPRLFKQFILRSMLREKTRSAIAMFGVSLGVAVVVAIRLANSSVTDTFRAAVDAVGGEASLRIRGEAGRFDELLLAKLYAAPAAGASAAAEAASGKPDAASPVASFGQLSPVVEAYAMVGNALGGSAESGGADESGETGSGFPSGETLHVLGVDVLLDFPLREYRIVQFGGGRQTAREALRLLDDSRSVILTEKFLRRHGLRVGDTVPLTFGTTSQDFLIRGVLLNEGPARTLDGNFALMDIATAQLAADRLGVLDYVDLLLPESADAEQLLPEIQRRLPEGLEAELPNSESGRADTMIAAFQFNLTALSAVALIVGLFLIYNTISMSVAARRAEIGVLQAVGASRRQVLLLFLAEAFVLALVGVAAGLPLGRLLGTAAVGATAQTVETFYIASVAQSSAAALRLTLDDVLAAVGVVIPLALLAAWRPAWEAASVQPVAAVRGAGRRLTRSGLFRSAGAAMVFLAIGWLMTRAEPVDGRPLFGFLAELMLMLGGALLTPLLLLASCRGARRLVQWTGWSRRTELRLAAANLEGDLPRVSVSVAALGVSLSMMIAIAVMVGSFRSTVVYWLDSALSADLSVKPVMQASSVSEARLSERACDVISNHPDVEETVWFSARQIPFRDRKIRLAVTELDKTLKRDRLIFKQRAVGGPQRLETPRALVSESFSLLYDSPAGAEVLLPTAAGPQAFFVEGVYYDYASNQGSVLLDEKVYDKVYGASDPSLTAQNLSAYLRPGADVERVRRELLERLGEDEKVYCVTSGEVRAEALKIFESTFGITYALEFIAIFVAGLGVATTLIALIYQRQRDIGLLSLIGATMKQVRRVIVYEAVILGGVSQAVGILVGLLLSLVLIYVINVQSFGWTIQFHMPWAFLVQSTLLVLAASALFGLYPAARAASIDALQTVREEHA